MSTMKLLETFLSFVKNLFKITPITALVGLNLIPAIHHQTAFNLFMKHFNIKQPKVSKAHL